MREKNIQPNVGLVKLYSVMREDFGCVTKRKSFLLMGDGGHGCVMIV